MNKTIQNTHSHKADITLLLGIIFIEVSAKTSVLVDDENTWNPVIFAALAQFGVPTNSDGYISWPAVYFASYLLLMLVLH